MNKFLLITYYWPPCGGVSVQRWLKLTKYFPMFDWLPTVITTENGDYPYIDVSLFEQIPAEIRVLRTKTPTFSQWFHSLLGKDEKLPYGSLQTGKSDSFLKRVLFFIRTQLVSPDARMIWNANAYNCAERTLISGMYEAVITTGPPHSTHLIGLKLKQKFGVKWIADFRDPWSKIAYLESKYRNFIIKKIDKHFEKKVVRTADAVVSVSEDCSRLLTKGNKYVINNAFDPDDFRDKEYHRQDVFRIKYVGSLFNSRMKEFLAVLEWINEFAGDVKRSNIEFSVIGTMEQSLETLKKFTNIHIKCKGFVPHPQAIAECVDSEAVLLVINQAQNNAGILTLKVFEYIGSQTFVLGVGPQGSEVNEILSESGGGEMFDYTDRLGFLKRFDELYRQWESGESVKNQSVARMFSVPAICQQYSNLLKEVVEEKC